MNLALRTKNWQILIVIICIPLVSFLAGIYEEASQPLFILEIVLVLIVAFLWISSLWIVAVSFGHPKGQLIFKILFSLTLGYMAFGVIGGIYFSDSEKEEVINIILPLHIFVFLSYIFCIGYSAKQLVSLERGSSASLVDYIGVALLWYFYPLGFWFIQPKLNKLSELETI